MTITMLQLTKNFLLFSLYYEQLRNVGNILECDIFGPFENKHAKQHIVA